MGGHRDHLGPDAPQDQGSDWDPNTLDALDDPPGLHLAGTTPIGGNRVGGNRIDGNRIDGNRIDGGALECQPSACPRGPKVAARDTATRAELG